MSASFSTALMSSFIVACVSVTCDIENEVVNNYHINDNLISKGWTRCYLQPYSESLSINTLISSCPTGADHYLFIGALTTASSVTVYVGAMAPSQVLIGYTSSTTEAFKPEPFASENPQYNVYWYNYPSHSFGFSPSSDIEITWRTCCGTPICFYGMDWEERSPSASSCVNNGLKDDKRLSWRADQVENGGRAGAFNLWANSATSNVWHKVVYYKHCPPTNAPTVAPTKIPTIVPTSSTMTPTAPPTNIPTSVTYSPTTRPTNAPTIRPTNAPTLTQSPSTAPSNTPSTSPSEPTLSNTNIISTSSNASTTQNTVIIILLSLLLIVGLVIITFKIVECQKRAHKYQAANTELHQIPSSTGTGIFDRRPSAPPEIDDVNGE